MKIKYIFVVNYVVAFFALILSLLKEGDVSSSLIFVGFPQWFAFIVTLGYLHAKNVLKAAGCAGDLKNAVNFSFSVVALALWFLVSISLTFVFNESSDGSAFYRAFLFSGTLSGLMGFYLGGVLIYIMYPLQVKLNAGVYKKLVD
ncbi:hypothetical protein ABN154_25660 [Klebsiella michiganensis]|uniref:hypothetical protein n=1 Tax=Klebsiella michiganensis TaxID=1134687 RepID=UPI0032DB2A1C